MPAQIQSDRRVGQRAARRLRELESRRDAALARIRPGGGEVFTILARVEALETQIDALLAVA